MAPKNAFAAGLCLIATSWSAAAFATPDTIACAAAFEEAQILAKHGKVVAAVRRAQTCIVDSCGSAVVTECLKFYEEARASMPSVVLAARDTHGNDLTTVDVRIDGEPVKVNINGEVPLDPGKHDILFLAPGLPSAAKEILLHPGEKLRMVSVVLQVVLQESVGSQHSSGAPVAMASDPSNRKRTLRILSGISAGIGAVAFGSFAGWRVVAMDQYNTLRTQCAGHCLQDQVNTVSNNLTLSNVALGTGIAAAALSVGLLGWSYALSDNATVNAEPHSSGGALDFHLRF